ncbi:carboxymuconolactone decarboxylase family protein [Rhodococcus sp. DMU1]|uniref:carboxymuconolactone decarboxylase family protein n=1 Tax=Rhodococcus sp. DMU1 TaxID=2722825 RepID=UPI00143ED328|nr:carboxymuconolactone decarboxylase family protein [Rhodococcus sp. DMU1]QIX53873.1 carboxymuconolactone decarboxylase family protein [Rhodococcus sp. DMU1]
MTASSGAQPPRIEPQDDEALLATLPARAVNGASGRNLFATMMRSPDLYSAWRQFARHLNSSEQISVRHRELLVLRTAWVTQCEYEWGSHVEVARAAGLSAHEIEAVRTGADHPLWNELESALLRVPDECRERAQITDETWQVLDRALTQEQLLEVLIVVGHYLMLAILINTVRIPLEPGVPGFDIDNGRTQIP